MGSTSNILLFLLSLLLVGFGQPVWSAGVAMLSSLCGFTLFWIATKPQTTFKQRFLWGTVWFTCVQLIQLSWALTHPYSYMYGVWVVASLLFGMQFGLVNGLLVYFSAKKASTWFFLSAVWTLMEWGRMVSLAVLSWNPIGLTLSHSLVSLQVAALFGVYGMSFCVFLTNGLGYRLYHNFLEKRFFFVAVSSYMLIALFPYLFGVYHLWVHDAKWPQQEDRKDFFKVLLVQPAFPIEEELVSYDPFSLLENNVKRWKKILHLLSPYQNTSPDLVVLPEHIVRFGTFYPVFPLQGVVDVFNTSFGQEGLKKMAGKERHLAAELEVEGKKQWMVNNAYWSQSMANIFNAEVVVGLEDEDYIDQQRVVYASAMVFFPLQEKIERYAKRVLVPLGEYNPFSWLKKLARNYQVGGSFTPGTAAKVIQGETGPYGLSICLEEVCGHLMAENRDLGAEMLVNLTNDYWYPNSLLPRQHFDHSRLRAVEMGIPLVRSANTGVTGAVDSLGRVIATFGLEEERPEEAAGALLVDVPKYTYATLYSLTGDWPVVLGSIFLCLVAFFKRFFLKLF